MSTPSHDFVTVDMRSLKAALVARARSERVSVSALVRGAVARELESANPSDLPAVATPSKGIPGSPTVKLSIRLASGEAQQLIAEARRAGLSQAQFERRMTKIFHLSAGQYLIKARIDHAARLLASTALPIADIAQHAGFSDQSALSRQFRQVTGFAPRQYRQLMRPDSED